jgi:hypothetical protein
MQNPNRPSIAAVVTCPVSAAVSDANAAIRRRAVPKWWRPSTFATPEADRSTPRPLRCRSSDLGPSVGRAIASDKITATSSLLIALGWCGPATFARQQRRQAVLLGLGQPLVVGVAGHAEHPAGLGNVADLGGMLDESDTTVLHNVFVGHGMAFRSLDLAIQRLPPVTHTCTEAGVARCHPNP